MAFLSQARHDRFVNAASTTIVLLENNGLREQATELKETLDFLENAFIKCDDLTNQLRNLIKQYERIEVNTRLKLRASRSKILKNNSDNRTTDPSF